MLTLGNGVAGFTLDPEQAGNKHFSRFASQNHLFAKLEQPWRRYSQSGTGTHRKYLHDAAGAASGASQVAQLGVVAPASARELGAAASSAQRHDRISESKTSGLPQPAQRHARALRCWPQECAFGSTSSRFTLKAPRSKVWGAIARLRLWGPGQSSAILWATESPQTGGRGNNCPA
jgi:hypothetical protein